MPRLSAGRNSVRFFLLTYLTCRLTLYKIEQERRKKLNAKKLKAPKAAGEAFLKTLLHPELSGSLVYLFLLLHVRNI
jgi:hypothetical protein